MTGSIQSKSGRKNYYAVLNVYDAQGKRKLKWVDTGVPVKGNNKRAANKRLQKFWWSLVKVMWTSRKTPVSLNFWLSGWKQCDTQSPRLPMNPIR